ncbi:MAG: glycosyltransferase, partial [Candidatus Kapabacteria bacterium]|nr:glycosyltransferase [Candidatus Kapabacteria bacterium]
MPSSWDICVLSMSEALYDARTLNVARSFVQEGWRTCLLSWGTPEAATFLQRLGIEGILRPRPALRRVWKQWLLFSLWVLRNRHSLQARVYWAADIYTLPFAAHLARRRQAIVFYDSRELFFALASLRKRPLAQRFLQWAESRYIHAACRCIVSGWLDADALQRLLWSCSMCLRTAFPCAVIVYAERFIFRQRASCCSTRGPFSRGEAWNAQSACCVSFQRPYCASSGTVYIGPSWSKWHSASTSPIA